MSEQEKGTIPGDLRERYADDLYERVNFTLVRDHNYGGFERSVTDSDELEATRTVAKELFVEKATLNAATESMKFERDESRAASQQSLSQWRESRERIGRLEQQLGERDTEIERLKLQSECADRWWDDDDGFDSPEEYADERGLVVGAEFELQAAAYWAERFRVKAVRNQETDEGDFDCEQLSTRREEFPEWFEIKAENATLKATIERLCAPVTEAEWLQDGMFEHEGDHNEGRLRAAINALLAARLAPAKEANDGK